MSRSWIFTAAGFVLGLAAYAVASRDRDGSTRRAASPDSALVGRVNMPGPEVQQLMLGTWAITVRYEPSAQLPRGGSARGREVWRAGPGGRSVIEEYQESGAAGEIRGLGIAWWDNARKGQQVVWCDSDDPGGCQLARNVARWQGDSLVSAEEITENGKTVIHQELFIDITAASFTQLLRVGPSLPDLATTTTIHAVRVAR